MSKYRCNKPVRKVSRWGNIALILLIVVIDTLYKAVEILLGSKMQYGLLIFTASTTFTVLILDHKLYRLKRRRKIHK